MYQCLAIADPTISAYDCLNGFGQNKIDHGQIDGNQDHNDNDNQGCRISFLTRGPMNFFELLPSFLEKFGRVPDGILDPLNPIPHKRRPTPMRWRVRQGSNLQQPDLESGALPIGATDPLYLDLNLAMQSMRAARSAKLPK